MAKQTYDFMKNSKKCMRMQVNKRKIKKIISPRYKSAICLLKNKTGISKIHKIIRDFKQKEDCEERKMIYILYLA